MEVIRNMDRSASPRATPRMRNVRNVGDGSSWRQPCTAYACNTGRGTRGITWLTTCSFHWLTAAGCRCHPKCSEMAWRQALPSARRQLTFKSGHRGSAARRRRGDGTPHEHCSVLVGGGSARDLDCPAVFVGRVRRFNVTDCLAWLERVQERDGNGTSRRCGAAPRARA